MGRRTPSCVLASLVIAATVALAGCASTSGNRMKVDSIVVFGDSYSDVGTCGVATGDPANPGSIHGTARFVCSAKSTARSPRRPPPSSMASGPTAD